MLGCVYVQKRMYEASTVEYKKVLDLVKGAAPVEASVKVIMAQAFARWGKKSEAVELLEDVAGVPASAYSLAGVYGALGDKDQAFEWFNKTVDEDPYRIAFIKTNPRFDSLRSDPRFADLLRRMKLVT